jgi:putative membrane protein
MGLFGGTKCFLCSEKIGFLDADSIRKNQEGFDNHISIDYKPNGMGKKDLLCRGCIEKQLIKNSDKFMDHVFKKTNPFFLRQTIKSYPPFSKIYHGYLDKHPEIKKKLNPQIEEIQQSMTQKLNRVDNYKEELKGIDNNQLQNLAAGTDSVLYEQMGLKVRVEIKRLLDETHKLNSELKKCPFFTSDENENKNLKYDNEDPFKILKIRYAKGEISKEEFDEMKKDLSS